MPENIRTLDIEILDDLPSGLVTKAVDFFHQDYPSDSKKEMGTDFFLSKIVQSNPNGHGYFTVATYEGRVVGTCTAVRKTLISDNIIINAVEIGDTFTGKAFRKSCYFSKLYPGTTSRDEYLNKSIFGRLATETLDRARADGVEYVYGTPNLQAKLSWLGRMKFKLVDGNFTYRISAASRKHSLYNSSKFLKVLATIYTKISFLFCLFSTRKYSMSLISRTEFNEMPDTPSKPSIKGDIQLVNTHSWINFRFINNIDKKYKVVKIQKRGHNHLCGYLFFLEQERGDGFKLMILSKDLLYCKQLERLKIPISRISSEKFFKYENLSIWVDSRRNSLRFRFLFGFLSKKIKVDIVGKSLTEESTWLESRNFYNFQYGDSDLG